MKVMKLKILYFFLLTILFFALTSFNKNPENINLKCLIQMINYNGEGAYVIVSLINPKGDYEKTLYVHGEGGTARTKAKNDMMSTVQGHIHTQAYTEWMVGRNFRIFGMQVGCGVDGKSYAAAYAKNFKKQAIGCAVILGGHTAINCLMEL